MTEQPAEPTTEQNWLGNDRPTAYLPGAQRIREGKLIDGPRIQGRPVDEPATGRSPLVSKFLDVVDGAFDKADANLVGRRATDAGLTRINHDIEASSAEPRRTSLDFHAEIHAGKAVDALSNGELDEGIAWLQSALAFAQNHRHATRHEGTDQ